MPRIELLESLKQEVAELRAAVTAGGDKDKIRAGLRKALQKSHMLGSRVADDEGDDDKTLTPRVIRKRLLEKRGDQIVYKSGADEKVIALQKWNDDIYILSKVLGIPPRETGLWSSFRRSELAKAMSHAAGVGGEWVPTGFSAEMIDRVFLDLECANVHQWVPMPTNPYTLPIKSAGAQAYLVAEQTAEPESATKVPATTPATTNVTLTAIKLGARSTFSLDIEEDSIIPVLPMIKEELQRAMKESIETATINGDTTSPHQDSDTTSATDPRKAWLGWRKLCQAGAKVSLATFNIENIRAIRKAMVKYGVKPGMLVYVTGFSGYSALLNLKDSAGNAVVLTVDKYGQNATILTGELGKLDGSPIIISEYLRQDLNASGVYDGTTTNKTILLVVHKQGCLYGDRRKATLKTDESIETDQVILVVTQRLAFSRRLVATEKFIGLGYNITT